MNKHFEWKKLLEFANDDLKGTGFSILITEPEEGFYDCDIMRDGEVFDNYAGNFYEDELDDLVNEVWHHVKANIL